MVTVKKPKESDVQRVIKKYLEFEGWYVYKNHQSLGSHRGLSDLTAFKKGQVMWIEVKMPKGKLSKHQEVFGQQVKANGCHFFVARSIECVQQYLKEKGI